MDAVEALSRNPAAGAGGLVLHPKRYFQTISRAASCMASSQARLGPLGMIPDTWFPTAWASRSSPLSILRISNIRFGSWPYDPGDRIP